jgi:hypothetical protein
MTESYVHLTTFRVDNVRHGNSVSDFTDKTYEQTEAYRSLFLCVMQTVYQCDSPAGLISLFSVRQITSPVTVNRRTDTGV